MDFFRSLSEFSTTTICTVISIIIVAILHKKDSKNLFSLAVPLIVSYSYYWGLNEVFPTSEPAQYAAWAWAFIPSRAFVGTVLAILYVGYNWYKLKKS